MYKCMYVRHTCYLKNSEQQYIFIELRSVPNKRKSIFFMLLLVFHAAL